MPKKIVIIGAGIAGMSAGIYARMNGYDTEIYEMHSMSGGYCTAWKRKGFTFDGCIHWLTGSKPGSMFYNFWEEIGAMQGLTFHNHESFIRTVGIDGREFILYSDTDRLEKHMKELSPEDALVTEEFCNLIRIFTNFNFKMDKPFELMNIFDIMKMIGSIKPHMKEFGYCSQTSVGEFAGRFRSRLIRESLDKMISPDAVLMSLVMSMGLITNKAAGFPLGGSLEFARGIEKRYLSLGGKIFFNKKVSRIQVSNHKAVGVGFLDDSFVKADYIISAGDVQTLIHHLLEGKYPFPFMERLFSTVKCFKTAIQVSLGIQGKLPQGIDTVGTNYMLEKPLIIGGTSLDALYIKDYSFDPSLAPEGKSFVMALINTEYDHWEKLSHSLSDYNAEKEKVLQAVVSELEKRFPGLKDRIEVSDVCTPMTYQRYTGNYQGTFMTWMQTPKNGSMLQKIPRKLPKLKNLYMAGMWMMAPGGLPSAVKTGRDTIQLICKNDHQHFKTLNGLS